ncbi:MAG: hypothetical protein ACRDRZ_03620 [Pseudonocardiaceae bacterium]
MAKPKKLRVFYVDGRELEVVITMKVRTDTEQHFDLPMSQLSFDKHAAYMAWLALLGSGAEDSDFGAFCEAVFDIGTVEGDTSAGPTGQARPPDTSSS